MKKLFIMAMLMICVMGFCGCGSMTQEEITLQAVVEANRMDVLTEEHRNVYVKQETIDINGFVRDTTYWYFCKEDEELTADTWKGPEEEIAVSNIRDGMICGLQGEDVTVTVIPEADYNNRIISMNPFLPTELDELESVTEEEDEFIVKTVRKENGASVPMETEYHVDHRTLRINRAEIYTCNGDGLKSSLVAMSVKYDRKEKPDRSAWDAIHKPSDNSFCEVTVIMEPRTAREEKQTLRVAKSCDVLVSGDVEYALFSDEAYKHSLSDVDTTGNQVTVYARPIR